MIIGKKELRKYIAELKTLHATSTTQQSVEILERLEAHPMFLQAQTILMYYSLPDEVDTHDFIRRWYTHKRILLPVVKQNQLELYTYNGPEHMRKGAFGIEEPTEGHFTDLRKIDLAVIPGVAFDRRGNRLGRGKGYYDRLLPYLTATYKLGICFSYQLLGDIPTDPFDIRMDEVLH